MPRPIKVNMFGLAFTKDAHILWKNGHPAQSTTGVASSSSTQGWNRARARLWKGPPGSMSAMARRNTGTVRARATRRRRVMSFSSGLSSWPRVAASGSRAMPHFGQLPGPGWRTSGCIGQV